MMNNNKIQMQPPPDYGLHPVQYFPDPDNLTYHPDFFQSQGAMNMIQSQEWDRPMAQQQAMSRMAPELSLNPQRDYNIANRVASVAEMYQRQMHPAMIAPPNSHLHQLGNHEGLQYGHYSNMGMPSSMENMHLPHLPHMGPHQHPHLQHALSMHQVGQIQLRDALKTEPGTKRKLPTSDLEDDEDDESTSSRNKKARNTSRWTNEQDQALKDAVAKYEGRNWKAIAELVPGRDHVQCLQRWKKVLRPGLRKGHWTPEEDALLLQLIQDEKMHSWAMVASKIKGRTAKQCRERWSLNLDPGINRSAWSPEEDALLLQLYDKMGGKWSEIKTEFEGRTENAVKTRYKSLVRAKAREWTPDQDRKLVQLRMKYGKNWAAIKRELPGRSRNAIKVRCKTLEYDNSTSS